MSGSRPDEPASAARPGEPASAARPRQPASAARPDEPASAARPGEPARFTLLCVLHDSAPELRALLASLDPMPPMVCVDADSRDDGPALAAAAGARVVALGANPGFGAANNAGLAVVETDVTVLVNPDVIAPGVALERLAALAAASDALHVPRLLNADGSTQDSAHALPGSAAGLAGALLPAGAMPAGVAAWLTPWRATDGPRPVGWAIAACVAARTSTLRALGPFDPDAFLFYEDLELCLRARAAGVPTLLHPSLRVTHTGQHATSVLGDTLLVQARRRREVVRACLGGGAVVRDDVAQALTFALRSPVRARARAQLRALRAARRSR